MDSWTPAPISWSFSTARRFEACRRRYFYHRFWGQFDGKLKWRLHEMRSLTTLMMLRGSVAHEVIGKALRTVQSGGDPSGRGIGLARDAVTEIIRTRFKESATKAWHINNRPPGVKLSEITNLFEHYYNTCSQDVLKARARETRDVAWGCVDNLVRSELWRQIVSSDRSLWREVEADGFPSFDLDGILVYTRVDFAHECTAPTIVDWKTGRPSGQDRRQLALYSLYTQSKWGWDPTRTRLLAVYLWPELQVEEMAVAGEEVEALRDEVRRSYCEITSVEPASGPAKPDDFPPAEDPRECVACFFRAPCSAAKGTNAHEDEDSDQDWV